MIANQFKRAIGVIILLVSAAPVLRAQTTNTNAMPAPICPIIATSKFALSDYEPPQHQLRYVISPMSRRREPTNSIDRGHFDWWPHRDTNVWIEATFAQPETISETQVYWFDDSHHNGGCSVPTSWKALYKDGDQWKPVETTSEYTVVTNQYNTVSFKSVTTAGLRLEIQLQPKWSAGIVAWKVK